MALSRAEVRRRYLARKTARGVCIRCPLLTIGGRVRCPSCEERHRARAVAYERACGSLPRGPRRCGLCGEVVSDHDRRRCPRRKGAV